MTHRRVLPLHLKPHITLNDGVWWITPAFGKLAVIRNWQARHWCAARNGWEYP